MLETLRSRDCKRPGEEIFQVRVDILDSYHPRRKARTAGEYSLTGGDVLWIVIWDKD